MKEYTDEVGEKICEEYGVVVQDVLRDYKRHTDVVSDPTHRELISKLTQAVGLKAFQLMFAQEPEEFGRLLLTTACTCYELGRQSVLVPEKEK